MSHVSPARLSLAAGVVAAGIGVFAHTGTALAYESCRSDPVLVVNGTAVDVVSTLATTPDVVRELDYTVTVPTGSLLGTTTLTVGLGFPEQVTYVYSAAQPWGTVHISASVQTQAGTAPFATTVQATSLLAGTQAASGYSNSTVELTVGHQAML